VALEADLALDPSSSSMKPLPIIRCRQQTALSERPPRGSKDLPSLQVRCRKANYRAAPSALFARMRT
jgi:hypothetical protein